MLTNNLSILHTQCMCSLNIISLFQSQNLASHHTSHTNPVKKRKYDKNGNQIGSYSTEIAAAGKYRACYFPGVIQKR